MLIYPARVVRMLLLTHKDGEGEFHVNPAAWTWLVMQDKRSCAALLVVSWV